MIKQKMRISSKLIFRKRNNRDAEGTRDFSSVETIKIKGRERHDWHWRGSEDPLYNIPTGFWAEG